MCGRRLSDLQLEGSTPEAAFWPPSFRWLRQLSVVC
jgi:hypothetical protein